MALFHMNVTQIKRSKGQSAIAAAAYRAGEKLHSEYYGEISDYTNKHGVICSEILLPDHAPREYGDRQTLWKAVEKAERSKNAQLAYSFDIALQNEFSLDENIALARRFLLEHFVSRGMVVDFAVHVPDTEPGGISNPHFHVMSPIRPIEENGKWGCKQHRVYELDEEGNRLLDENGNYIFNAVPTTDWGSPETLEYWREQWAAMCNAKFEEKGNGERIDHRSYERQDIDLLPKVLALANSILESYQEDTTEKEDTKALLESKRRELARLTRKMDNYIDMRAEGDLTREQYRSRCAELEPQIQKLQQEIQELSVESQPVEVPDYKEKITFLQYALERYTNIDEGQDVPESVIEAFVEKIVVSKDGFDWYLRFDGDPDKPLHCELQGKRKTNTKISISSDNSPAMDSSPTGCYQGWQELRNYRKFASLTVTCEDAKAYMYSLSSKRRVHKWTDIQVNLYI